MMILRAIILTVICLGLTSHMTYTIYSGLRSGKVGHTDSRMYCERAKNPLGYWSLMGLFTAFGMLGVYAWLVSVVLH
jgi:hypothetical protein